MPVEIIGNPNGYPMLYLHGGPGYLCSESETLKFDLNKFKLILVQQRGAVLSSNPGSITSNTTQDLINDFEILRKALNIRQYALYGQSWGSFLALYYSITHPDVISHCFIKGIFLGRKKDIDWLYDKNLLGSYSNEVKKYFKKLLYDKDNLRKFADKVLSDTCDIDACVRWTMWEDINCGNDKEEIVLPLIDEAYRKIAYAVSRIELHYFINKCFVDENYILDNLKNVRTKLYVIQGQEDRICPIDQAEELVKKARELGIDTLYQIIENCGHTTSEDMAKKIYGITSNIKLLNEIN
jgi:proline iminopeptidase